MLRSIRLIGDQQQNLKGVVWTRTCHEEARGKLRQGQSHIHQIFEETTQERNKILFQSRKIGRDLGELLQTSQKAAW